ncbi:hypothetical protein [Streptosporangium sp. CA-115845]|uniref:hypothetical protein n=1 Tax=Streptosporangium sp. CA-115845 TaxID=3240071 RepID=UPI003D93DF83
MSNEPGWRSVLLALLTAGLLVGDAAGSAPRQAGSTGVRQIGELASHWHLRYAAAAGDITQRIIPSTGNRAWLFTTDRRRPATSLLRWNGTSWNPVGSLPKQLRKAGYLDVSASASGDVVLVINHVPGKWDSSTEHLWQFSGGRWTHHRPRYLSWTSDFAVVDQNHAWFAQGGDPEGPPPAMVHRNGAAWRWETPPEATDLTAVAAAGPDDVWVVDHRGRPRTLHWDGRQWKDVPLPCAPALARRDCHERPLLSHLSSLAVRSKNDVWAVGSDWTGGARSVVLHWNGTAWSQVKINVSRTRLGTVRTDPVGGVWIAANPAEGTPYVLNLRNGRWSRSALPRGESSTRILDIAPAPGTARLWVHARHGNGPGETSLIYELQTAAQP